MPGIGREDIDCVGKGKYVEGVVLRENFSRNSCEMVDFGGISIVISGNKEFNEYDTDSKS